MDLTKRKTSYYWQNEKIADTRGKDEIKHDN